MTFCIGRLAKPLLLLFICFLLPAILADHVQAQGAPGPGPVTITVDGKETPEELKKVIDGVASGGRPVTIEFAAKPEKPAAEDPSKMLETADGEFVDLFTRGINDSLAALPRTSQFFADLRSWWAGSPPSSGFILYLLKLLGLLGISAVIGAIVHKLLQSIAPVKLAPEGAQLKEKLRPAAFRLIRDVSSTVVFILAARFLAGRFFDPMAAEGKATAQLLDVLPFVAGHLIVGNILLSPSQPRLRLLMIPRASWHFLLLSIYSIAGMFILTIIGVGNAIGGLDHESAGLFMVLSTFLSAFKIWWFWNARYDIAELIISGASGDATPHVLRRLFAAVTPWFLILSTLLLWALGRVSEAVPGGTRWATALGATQILIVLSPILAVGASILARQRLMTADPGRTPLQIAMRVLWVKLYGVAAWLFCLALLGWTWRSVLLASQSAEGLIVIRSIVSVIALAIAGWALTSFLNALFKAYGTQSLISADEGETPSPASGVQTRLGSVMPILRGLTIGATIAVFILLALTQLGFDVAPLLAGFTILGLAVSFGSQTLVKDIVSGFFFMVEDAFRVGEYIDTGKLKGTVEKIGLRALQLRHQSGLIHTIPFGTLSQVTNASRDWATVKFSLRLDRSTDIEKARKAIKKIGLELMEDPEFGKGFLSPLKMQGVDEIADSAIIIRAKFTAQPALASAIQREALKRVYVAFNKSGIEFASNAVTVKAGGSTEAAAASAASSPSPVPAAAS